MRVAAIAVMLSIGVLSGCGTNGPKLVPVSGKVVFEDGVAMQGGLIEFTSITARPEDGVSSRGPIGPDGDFRDRKSVV